MSDLVDLRPGQLAITSSMHFAQIPIVALAVAFLFVLDIAEEIRGILTQGGADLSLVHLI